MNYRAYPTYWLIYAQVRGRSGPWCFCQRGPSPSPSPKKKDGDGEPRSPDAPKRDPVVYEGELALDEDLGVGLERRLRGTGLHLCVQTNRSL